MPAIAYLKVNEVCGVFQIETSTENIDGIFESRYASEELFKQGIASLIFNNCLQIRVIRIYFNGSNKLSRLERSLLAKKGYFETCKMATNSYL